MQRLCVHKWKIKENDGVYLGVYQGVDCRSTVYTLTFSRHMKYERGKVFDLVWHVRTECP